MGFSIRQSVVRRPLVGKASELEKGLTLDKMGMRKSLTRGSQEPVIAHLVFNLTSKVDRKWGCYT